MSEGRLASLQFKFEIWLVGQEWVGRQTLKSCMASLTYIFFSGRKPCWENSQIWAAWTCSLQAVTELGGFSSFPPQRRPKLGKPCRCSRCFTWQGTPHPVCHSVPACCSSSMGCRETTIVIALRTCRLDVRQISQGCDIDGEVIYGKGTRSCLLAASPLVEDKTRHCRHSAVMLASADEMESSGCLRWLLTRL